MSAHPEIMTEQEKADVIHVGGPIDPEPNGVVSFETDETNLPPGYYTSVFFIGTLTAISIGFFAGVAGFGLIAPILLVVNADIGPVCCPCLHGVR